MKRRKASTKMTNVVHSGWMTKSPPERKLSAPFKIFRSQWKKRYFVLSKPLGSLPDQYELHYYKDQSCRNKKGSIDLEQCEQIIEALDSEVFANLLAIKTYYKNKVRTYYLAADTEQDMNTWVQWLCHVCGLKPEDQPTDIPEPKPSQTQIGSANQAGGLGANATISNGTPVSPPRSTPVTTTSASSALSTSPHSPAGSRVVSSQPIARTGSGDSLSYIPLENCTTGQPQPVDRRGSAGSVPDFLAPEPPQKRRGSHSNGATASDDEVFVQPGLYDHPPRPIEAPRSNVASDLYKVPPARLVRDTKKLGDEENGRDSSYDVPPPRTHSPITNLSARTNSAASGGTGVDRAVTPTECYDYPPPRLDSTASSDSEIPPERPPKPGHLQSPYQNLPPTGKIPTDADLMNTVPAPPKAHSVRACIGYDVPPPSHHRSPRGQNPGLSFVTPAPRQSGQVLPGHNYLNTPTRPGKSSSDDDHGSDPVDNGAAGPPAIPPPRASTAGESQDGHSASSSLYQTPPPSSASSSSSGAAPARPPARNPGPGPSVSPRSYNGSPASNQAQEDNTAVIFSTQRTRSFKRHHNVNSNSPKPSHKAHTLPMTTTVPTSRPALPSRPKEISTSDEDEETHHPLSLLHSVPPPSGDNDGELKYIDLALPDTGQEPARFSHSHGHGHTHSHSHSHADRGKESATEYREIDFVKTQALNDTKRVKEKERKIDEH